MNPIWQDIYLPASQEDRSWELFHENSKLGRYHKPLTDDQVLTKMASFHDSLPYEGYPRIKLPQPFFPLNAPLGETIVNRTSVRRFGTTPVSFSHLAALLHYSYGVSRSNDGTSFPRPFRTAPSAGALYPLELFVHAKNVDGLLPGLYHYNPSQNSICCLLEGDQTAHISRAVVQPGVIRETAIQIFLTAIFERSTFKYGERGYRFVLIEAGHVAQNMNLVSASLGLGVLNIGGYFDQEIDDWLSIDGITHSTVYMLALGTPHE